jgi:hypothetical protein
MKKQYADINFEFWLRWHADPYLAVTASQWKRPCSL